MNAKTVKTTKTGAKTEKRRHRNVAKGRPRERKKKMNNEALKWRGQSPRLKHIHCKEPARDVHKHFENHVRNPPSTSYGELT